MFAVRFDKLLIRVFPLFFFAGIMAVSRHSFENSQ